MESRFTHEFSQVRPQAAAPQAARLTIGPANDSYEQEADEVADKAIQRWPTSSAKRSVPSTGHDFGDVRIHTGSKAAESARAIGANAYTIGRDIVFGNGQFKPETIEGRKLLAHEITHVSQHVGNSSKGLIQRQKCSNISRGRATVAATIAENLSGKRSGTQADPYIWFDSWFNDERDNNNWDSKKNTMKKDVKIDMNDPEEAQWLGFDGNHLVDLPTYVCSDEHKRADQCDPGSCSYNSQGEFTCPAVMRKIVRYRTCIDIPTQAYAKAFLNFPVKITDQSRDVGTAVDKLGGKDYPDWQILRKDGKDLIKFNLIPGDFVAQDRHHSGIFGLDNFIHLPGPRTLRKEPSRTNDIVKGDFSMPTYVARPPGECIRKIKRHDSKRFAKSNDTIPESFNLEDCPCMIGVPPGNFAQTEDIFFLKDRPQPWYDSISSFKVSVTEESKAKFNEIANLLMTQTELFVQLEGHASSEKPANDDEYNSRLADRRTRLIAQELIKRSIDPNRIQDPPLQSCSSGCQEIEPGLLSCGDLGSNPSVDPKDRKVIIRIFKN